MSESSPELQFFALRLVQLNRFRILHFIESKFVVIVFRLSSLPMAEVGVDSMIVVVTFGRSSFVGRSIVAALLGDGRFTVRVIEPLPAPDPTPSLSPFFQSGRVSCHLVDIRHRSPSLLTAFTGADAVFHVDPTVKTLQSPPALTSDFYELHVLLVQSTRNVIAACLECGVHRFVYMGSADVVIGGANEACCWNESVVYPERVRFLFVILMLGYIYFGLGIFSIVFYFFFFFPLISVWGLFE